jgi:biotin operon repressor
MDSMSDKQQMFSGVFIPREVLLDVDITASGKIIYAIIQSLDNEKGCFASNEYIGTMIGLSDSSVRSSIGDLIKKGYVVRIVNECGQRTIRTITTVALKHPQQISVTPRQISDAPPPENKRPPAGKLATYSNKNNNSYNIQDLLIEPLPHSETFHKVWDDWVAYRKERKKPLTPLTIKHQLQFLSTLNENDATNSIVQSIKHGWLGIFATSGNNKTSRISAKPLTSDDHNAF